jgi:carbon monoxide dehydrogenase subunit G
MKVDGSSILHATPDRVWQAITDPAVLGGVIPGCQQLTPLGDNHFGLTVSMGVAAIKGTYAGEVRLYDLDEPHSLTMRAAGAGAPGTIDTTVAVRLTDAGDGTTRLDYDADAVVGGMVGGVGQRVLTSVARKTAGLFFAAIDDVLTGRQQPRAAVQAAGVTGGSAGSGGSGGPAAAGGRGRSDEPAGAVPLAGERPFGATLPAAGAGAGASGPGPLALLAAALLGAVALGVGVVLGARIGRRQA